MTIQIIPATMGTCGLAVWLFGVDRVCSGGWLSPLFVINLNEEEVNFAIEMYAEYDVKVKVV